LIHSLLRESNDIMPSKIINLDDARKKNQGNDQDLFALLSRIDELEDALDTLDELGIQTRNELEALIGKLEAEAERIHGEPKD
jgi:hypothetical protein